MFKYYNDLPDYLPEEELRTHLHNLLEAFEIRKTDLNDFIESLRELSIRWWHTYTLLEPDWRTRIDLLISEIMKTEEWKGADLLLCGKTMTIIGSLGLQESYKLLTSSITKELDQKNQLEVLDFVKEIEKINGGKIEDPYASLREK